MLLTPTELERLTIFTAAELARRRRAKGLKLNYPEAVAIITDEILEGAREGRSVADLIGYGSTILSTDDVLSGIASMMTAHIVCEGLEPGIPATLSRAICGPVCASTSPTSTTSPSTPPTVISSPTPAPSSPYLPSR